MPAAPPITPIGKIAAALMAGDDDALGEARKLAAGLDPYIEEMSSPPSEALSALERATRSEDWAGRSASGDTALPLTQVMLSGHLEGQFLAMLIGFSGARRVLEIGMFTGYGALAMAEALPADGMLVALEIDDFAADFAQGHFDGSPHGRKIEILRGPAIDGLATLASRDAQFDLVFIDADKPGYIAYYDTLLEHDLLAPGGMICVDNTLLGGEAYADAAERSANGEAIAAFNAHVANDDRTRQVLLPLRDGVTLIRRAD